MNMYLLLRDNKQSGPFTAEELITKGIKQDDLVWVEGKSTAWRYPQEVQELQSAFASGKFKNHSKDNFEEPKVSFRQAVHVSLPGNSNSPVNTKKTADAVYSANAENIDSNKNTFSYLHSNPSPSQSQEPVIKYVNDPIVHRTDSRLHYTIIIACFLLLVTASYFIINYKSQKDDIVELNEIIQKLEQKAISENTVIMASSSISRQEVQPFASSSIEDFTPRKESSFKKRQKNNQTQRSSAILVSNSNSNFPASSSPDNSSFVAIQPEDLYALVSLKSNKFKKGLLGGISDLQLELTNNSSKELRRVVVKVNYLGPEKRVIRTQTVFFENIGAGATSMIEVPKSSRGVSIDYTIVDIEN